MRTFLERTLKVDNDYEREREYIERTSILCVKKTRALLILVSLFFTLKYVLFFFLNGIDRTQITIGLFANPPLTEDIETKR